MLTYDEIEHFDERKSSYLLDAPPIASAKDKKRPAEKAARTRGTRNRVAKAVIDQAPTQADGAAAPSTARVEDACVVTDVPEASGRVPSEVAVPPPPIAQAPSVSLMDIPAEGAPLSPVLPVLAEPIAAPMAAKLAAEPEAPVASAASGSRFARMCCALRSICGRWLRRSTRARS